MASQMKSVYIVGHPYTEEETKDLFIFTPTALWERGFCINNPLAPWLALDQSSAYLKQEIVKLKYCICLSEKHAVTIYWKISFFFLFPFFLFLFFFFELNVHFKTFELLQTSDFL